MGQRTQNSTDNTDKRQRATNISHTPLIPLDQVESQANHLYMTGQREKLLAIWETLDDEARVEYFNLALNVIKIFLESGNYYEAEKALRIVAIYHEQHNNREEQARIHLQRA